MVKEGDKVKVEKLNAPEGGEIKFKDVLLVADKDVKIGVPLVDGAEVKAKVAKQGRGRKVIVFHYHSKTRYRKKRGHRQHFTELQIESIK